MRVGGGMTFLRRLVHFVFENPTHEHYYSLHVERDAEGNVKPYWRCQYLLCGEEIEVEEWQL